MVSSDTEYSDIPSHDRGSARAGRPTSSATTISTNPQHGAHAPRPRIGVVEAGEDGAKGEEKVPGSTSGRQEIDCGFTPVQMAQLRWIIGVRINRGGPTVSETAMASNVRTSPTVMKMPTIAPALKPPPSPVRPPFHAHSRKLTDGHVYIRSSTQKTASNPTKKPKMSSAIGSLLVEHVPDNNEDPNLTGAGNDGADAAATRAGQPGTANGEGGNERADDTAADDVAAVAPAVAGGDDEEKKTHVMRICSSLSEWKTAAKMKYEPAFYARAIAVACALMIGGPASGSKWITKKRVEVLWYW